jgi:endonuclease/exonuclease/phosphatase family metal-dependent hydrolase
VRLDGALLRVVGMHLDLSGLWRRRQAHAILAHLAERAGAPPTVLMGDLNEWSSRGGCLRDFAAHHLFAPCGRSFHARRPIAQLDRIMVTPDLEIVASGAHSSPASRRASDHLPIWAELRLAEEVQLLPPSFSGRSGASGWASKLRSSISSQSRKGRR